MLRATTQLSNQIRGLMKTFDLVVPKGAGRVFEGHVRSLLSWPLCDIATGSMLP
jgi:transposase